MTGLKERLRADLTAAMKAKQTIELATLRMALASVKSEEVAGKTARELTDDEVLKVLGREVKKRNEAAEAFANAGRKEQADTELAEAAVLKRYLPEQLEPAALQALIQEAILEVSAQSSEPLSQKHMGQIMKAANTKVAGRAEGAQVAALVRAALQG